MLECLESKIPEGRRNYSSGPLSFLEGSSAGMLGERDTGGEGKGEFPSPVQNTASNHNSQT